MEKWEYKVVNDKLSNYQLDIYGREGWELVAVTKVFLWMCFYFEYQYIFKRKIQESNG